MNSVRLDPSIKEKVRHIAQIKGMTLSEIHRLALERYCEQELAQTRTSRYSDIIGVGEGDADLSSRSQEIFQEIVNRKHG
jgi:predicted transcriptional regulator